MILTIALGVFLGKLLYIVFSGIVGGSIKTYKRHHPDFWKDFPSDFRDIEAHEL